jgi:anti-anti-sigma regulatory factor
MSLLAPIQRLSSDPAARVITPTGALTAATMPTLRRWVATRLSEGVRRIVVDLSQVSSVDESARAGLVICARAARAAHSVLVVTPHVGGDETAAS